MSTRFRQQVLPAFLIALAILVPWFCYLPGIQGDFHYDDRPSLAGLEQVEDARSAVEYLLSGIAGPTGRPLALASFLVNKPDWPGNPDGFIRMNVLVHLVNGLLVAWLALRICLARREPLPAAGYVAAFTAGLWVLLPILASTSLLVVQRMTSLAALLVLLGLVCFLWCRDALDRRPGAGLAGMAASLVVFSVLAVLAKENGALLPLFALLIEGLLLPSPSSVSPKTWRLWRGFFLWLPTAIVLAIPLMSVPYSESTIQFRGFTAVERLWSQTTILWEYLLHAFLPVDTSQLGPFHDAREASDSFFAPLTLLSVAAWASAITAAWIWRRKAPVFSFALFWFLGGHVLESTFIPLELYFEHRNYLPLIGPAFAIAWAAVNAPRRLRTFTCTALVAYTGLLALTLWMVASLWGDPFRHAQIRYKENPGSSRAVSYLTGHFFALGWAEPADILLGQAIDRGVAPARFRAVRLYLHCVNDYRAQDGHLLQDLKSGLEDTGPDLNLPRNLYLLVHAKIKHDCSTLELSEAESLIRILAANPNFAVHGPSRYWIHRALAKIEAARGNREARKHQLREALQGRFGPLLLQKLVSLQIEDGESRAACDALREFWRDTPWDPRRRVYWYLVLEELAREVERRGEGDDCRLS